MQKLSIELLGIFFSHDLILGDQESCLFFGTHKGLEVIEEIMVWHANGTLKA